MSSYSPWYTPLSLSDVEDYYDVLGSETEFELALYKVGSTATTCDIDLTNLEIPLPTWTFEKTQNACLPLPNFPGYDYEKTGRPLPHPPQPANNKGFSPPFLAVNFSDSHSKRQVYEDDPVAYVRMPPSRFFGCSKRGQPSPQQRAKPAPPPPVSHSFEKFKHMSFDEIQSFECKSFDSLNPQPLEGPKSPPSLGSSSEPEGEPALTRIEKNVSSMNKKPPNPPQTSGCSWLSPGLNAAISNINSFPQRYNGQNFEWTLDGYCASPRSDRRDSVFSATERLPLSAWNPENDLKMNMIETDDLHSWPGMTSEPNMVDIHDFEIEKPVSPHVWNSTRASSKSNLYATGSWGSWGPDNPEFVTNEERAAGSWGSWGSWGPDNPGFVINEERGYTEPIIGTEKYDPLVSTLENLPKSDGLLNPPAKVLVPDRYSINRDNGSMRTFNYGLRTTIRFTGLGNFCDQESVLKWLTEELQLDLCDFDFLYVPVDTTSSRGVGYTFVNFKCISKMAHVIRRVSSKDGVYFLNHRVSWDFARIQGFANLQALFRNHKLSTNLPITCANGTVIPILAQCHD